MALRLLPAGQSPARQSSLPYQPSKERAFRGINAYTTVNKTGGWKSPTAILLP